MSGASGLYLHIPFCDAKCHYCDFVTFVDKTPLIDPYLASLRFELTLHQKHPIKTLFIGGGTPTVLNPSQIRYLMNGIHETLDTSRLTEATVEANPESATIDKLAAFQKGGINRLSFGLQTTDDAVLADLGRLHNRERFFKTYETARELGFENINVDLMFGLPRQQPADWEKTLDEVIDLGPEHISAYALKIEPGTEFYRRGIEVDGDREADMYLVASEKLVRAGYVHYEISNFAKPGKESRHNLLYWNNDDTIGVGISSAGYREGRRVKNGSSLKEYIDHCSQGRPPVHTESRLGERERFQEGIMLRLRLRSGVEAALMEQIGLSSAKTFLDQGLAEIRGGRYALTPRGWLLSNQLFQHLVS